MHPGADRFGLFLLDIFILQYWGEMVTVGCLGLLMNATLSNSVAALVQAAAVVIASGFLKKTASLVKPYQWFSWILIHKYNGEILVANEFRDLELDCKPNSTDIHVCVPNGNYYIDKYYPGSDDRIVRNFGAIGAYAAGTLVLAVLAFKVGGLRNLH